MKAFRGTLIALLVLVLCAVVVRIVKPELFQTKVTVEETRLFTFEKQDLVRIEVQNPKKPTIALVEKDGEWTIEGTDFTAGRSMVNRVKHQIHDLTARATVIEDPEEPELYGLGANAIHVVLTLRDGRSLEFLAGDPNPTAVSYYIQPVPGSMVYTVKKSAVDYYGLTLEEFRERRFASFDGKDATGISASLRLDGVTRDLVIEGVGERQWQMHKPVEMGAEDDRVRRLFGRVSALKADSFIQLEAGAPADKLAEYGLAEPRADITVTFASREPLRLLVGKDAPAESRFEELAYMMLSGDDTVYVARRGLLEEFSEDPTELRNRKIVSMKAADVTGVDATLRAEPPDEDLAGQQGVRYAAEQWVWRDGVPVPGSTPERVAETLADLQVESFVTDAATNLATYGLDNPVAVVTLTDAAGNTRVVRVGSAGPAEADPEGHPRERRYVSVGDDRSVYLVDLRVLSVIRDLIREGNRKGERDSEKAARKERIPSVAEEPAPEAGGAPSGGPPPGGPRLPERPSGVEQQR